MRTIDRCRINKGYICSCRVAERELMEVMQVLVVEEMLNLRWSVELSR